MDLNTIKEFQDNGGIIISIVVVGVVIGLGIIIAQYLNWSWWSSQFKDVIQKSYDAVTQHELNHHHKEVIQRATKDRRSGKHQVWTGEERRRI
jgi:predicted negative regulator of RcsB-dependent stress response